MGWRPGGPQVIVASPLSRVGRPRAPSGRAHRREGGRPQRRRSGRRSTAVGGSWARTGGDVPAPPMDEPDAFEKARLILARARRQGQPFEVIWPKAVDAAAPV